MPVAPPLHCGGGGDKLHPYRGYSLGVASQGRVLLGQIVFGGRGRRAKNWVLTAGHQTEWTIIKAGGSAVGAKIIGCDLNIHFGRKG